MCHLDVYFGCHDLGNGNALLYIDVKKNLCNHFWKISLIKRAYDGFSELLGGASYANL